MRPTAPSSKVAETRNRGGAARRRDRLRDRDRCELRGWSRKRASIGVWWVPRILLSGVIWATYGVYLYLHYGRAVSGRTAAIVAFVGAVFVIAVAVLARTDLSGFHTFAASGL